MRYPQWTPGLGVGKKKEKCAVIKKKKKGGKRKNGFRYWEKSRPGGFQLFAINLRNDGLNPPERPKTEKPIMGKGIVSVDAAARNGLRQCLRTVELFRRNRPGAHRKRGQVSVVEHSGQPQQRGKDVNGICWKEGGPARPDVGIFVGKAARVKLDRVPDKLGKRGGQKKLTCWKMPELGGSLEKKTARCGKYGSRFAKGNELSVRLIAKKNKRQGVQTTLGVVKIEQAEGEVDVTRS